MSILSAPYFHNEESAIAHLEGIVWANGIVCPKCGTVDNSGKLQGKTARAGLRKCYSCRKQFTVKVGTCLSPATFRCTSGFRLLT
jgi:transposase-like protein